MQVQVTASDLIPSNEQLGLRVLEETTNVSASEGKTSNTDAQQHAHTVLQVAPVGHVVTSPDGTVFLHRGAE